MDVFIKYPPIKHQNHDVGRKWATTGEVDDGILD
jgi:hypothetical protein